MTSIKNKSAKMRQICQITVSKKTAKYTSEGLFLL